MLKGYASAEKIKAHYEHAADFHHRLANERTRQIQKWGLEWRSPEVLIAVLMEEVGEVAKAALEDNGEQYLIELVQVAAVDCQMYEAYQERERDGHMIAELEGLKQR